MKNLISLFSERFLQKKFRVIFGLIILTDCLHVEAQPVLTFYSDAGKNMYSDALYIRSAFLGNYQLGTYCLKTAIQTNLINSNENTMSGFRFEGSKIFELKNTKFELNGFGLLTLYSETLKESNYGCLLTMKSRHFDLQFGTNFRTYNFRKNALKSLEIENAETEIHENFNLMYSFGYNLNPSNHRWNAGLRLTNFDYFLINQETNPFVNVNGFFKVSSPLHVFAEVWYKTSGTLNMSSDYFGFLIRGGIVWNFN